ncbi:putative membrane protein [Yersinia enterocolitica subsp. palearctica Y11]|nr:putative membrane protein [Yersinia enterocolitica subsp. palearctica Y11]
MWARNLADLLAYVSFQSPVYALILWSVGADLEQITTAVASNALVSMAMGVAYGYFLEYCRKLFRVAGYI